VPDLPVTIQDAAAALRAGEVTATALATTALERATASFDALGAFVTLMEGPAMAAAAAADADLAAGRDRGPLQGIPLAIKDIIATRDAPTTANSRVLDPAWGAGVDAPVVARLRDAGAVIMGKATTNEFAFGMPDDEKGFPIPKNPWNLDHTAGGSSSGTGVAVAAGLALGGLGTDTGGSVRWPAAMNGHTGLKVTFGRVPKHDVVPLGFTLDSVGPMARSAWDCAALLEVIAGHDARDPYSADVPVPAYTAELTGDVAGLRIGVPTPYFFDDPAVDPEVRDGVRAALDVLAAMGAELVEVEVPGAALAGPANALTLVGEAFAYHRNDLVERWTTYGRFTRTNLGRGALYSAADYAQAQRFRSAFRRDVARVLSSVDVLVTPTWPTTALRRDAFVPGGTAVAASFTGPWNLAGLPACATPCGFSSAGLPISMQVVGRPFAEGTVLQVADAYQRGTDFHLRVPPAAVAIPA
jgi:aspartyl-tRNA(Asn)/glutamyl-tRNA(Gln) amidotransferase subunit A